MSEWKMVKLGEILRFLPKAKVKAGNGLSIGKYRFFTSSNVQSKFLDYYTCDETALIFGTGGNASVHFCDEKFASSTDCLVATAKEMITLKIISLYLQSNMFLLEEGFKGAGLKHISKDYICNIFIPLPPLEIQQKIAGILDKASSLIELRKAQIKKLDLLVKSKFIDLFGDPGTNPMGWKICMMGDVISILTDYHANGGYETLAANVELLDTPDYALMVRTTDLEKNNFVDGVKYISKSAYEFLNKSKIFGEEIIMNKIGSAGKVYLMPKLNRPVSLAMNQFLLRFNESVLPIYVYYYLENEYLKQNIQERVRGAVTKTITKEAVREIPFICPPITLQTQFADFVEQVEQQKAVLNQSLEKLEINYKALMQGCFNGEIF